MAGASELDTSATVKRYDPTRYDFGSYDRYLCLKPPLLLILSIVFLCRGFLMPLIVLLTSFKGGPGDTMLLVSGQEHAMLLLPAIPAVLVLYALVRRSPAAPGFVRSVWKHAKLLLVLSIVVDVALGVLLWSGKSASDRDLLTLARMVTDAYILTYILFSKRVSDTLSDFPAALDAARRTSH